MAIIDFDTECWDDPFFQSLSPLGRYLFMYLWTNPHRSVAGLYTITTETICNETRLSPKQVNSLLEEISPKVKYDLVKSVCWVVKHVRRQFLRTGIISEQIRKGIRKAVLKFYYHPFFEEFIYQYPEIFDPKERETLYRPSIDPPIGTSVDLPGGGGGGGGGSDLYTQNSKETLVINIAKPKNPVSPDVKSFIDFYFEKFKESFEKLPVIDGGKDGKLIKSLLRVIPLNDLENLLVQFFDSEDPFILKSGYTIGAFKSQINKLRIGQRSKDGIDLWLKVKEEQDARKGQKALCGPHETPSSDIRIDHG